MSPSEIRACLDSLTHGEIQSAITSDAERRLLAFIAAGGTVPGFKAARRVGHNRVWKSEAYALQKLKERGFPEEVLLEKPRLRSVAQIERELGREAVAELWKFPEREIAIVPEDSPLERVEYAKPNA